MTGNARQENMTNALRALVSCMGSEAKDTDVHEVAEEYGVDVHRLQTLYSKLCVNLDRWLDGQLYYL